MNKAILAIIAFGGISTFLVFVLLPTVGSWMEEQSVPVQFMFFNFIVFALISVSMMIVFKDNIKSIKYSIVATIVVLAVDLNLPDYAVRGDGTIATATALGFFGSSDYAFAAFYQWLGVHGPFLAFCVYPLTSVLLMLLAFSILGGKKFTEVLKKVTSL